MRRGLPESCDRKEVLHMPLAFAKFLPFGALPMIRNSLCKSQPEQTQFGEKIQIHAPSVSSDLSG